MLRVELFGSFFSQKRTRKFIYLKKRETEILIIGGGIAGCIAAIALAEQYQVTLIDKLAEPKERIGESLAPTAQRILKELKLLEGMNAAEDELYLNSMGMQSYWGSEQVQINDHLKNPDGFSRSLDRKVFEIYLRKAAEERGVNCLWQCQLVRSRFEDKRWNITIKKDDNEETIAAHFVIDASGRQSHFARSIGVKRKAFDQLIACWMTLPNQSKNTLSTIASVEKGWWYSAVIPNNKRVLAFQTDADLFEPAVFKNLETMAALAKENQAIARLLDNNRNNITLHGTVSANSTQLEHAAGEQWAAIGDAAMSFDPLSSQGMFNAIASAMQLADLMKNTGLSQTQVKTNYQNQMDSVWEYYLNHKNLFYGMEQRWQESNFWKRRQIKTKYNYQLNNNPLNQLL